MQEAKTEARIRRKFRLIAVELDERRRRQWAAVEARDEGACVVGENPGVSLVNLKD